MPIECTIKVFHRILEIYKRLDVYPGLFFYWDLARRSGLTGSGIMRWICHGNAYGGEWDGLGAS